MFKKILKISDLNKILKSGLVCAYEEEKNKEGNFEISFHYLTSNSQFINKHFTNSEKDDSFDFNGNCLFNLLEDKIIKEKAFQAFSGEIVHIGSLRSIQYKKYLNDFNRDNFSLDFSKELYCIDNFEQVYIESINEELDNEFVFEVLFKNFDSSPMFINKKGENQFGELVVSNFSKKDFENLFQEDEGYLFLGNKSGPKYISKKILNKLSDLNDVSSLGIYEDESYSLLPVIKISYDDTVVDMIVLNNDIRNKLDEEISDKESVNFSSLDNDSNIYFEDIDIIEDIDDELNLDDELGFNDDK